ncbi:MAG: 30S ribosomal protein S3 [Erysipelotrichaceae bacterium]|nr:30S ribosomal protein S3 [Erysipelotrichaceae bacterium]
MGQKVSPIGMRVGVIRDWDSRWYAEKDYATLLNEDGKIRNYLNKKLHAAYISRVEIERTKNEVKLIIRCSRPGVATGKNDKGESLLDTVKKDLIKLTNGKTVKMDIVEVANPDLDARLVARKIAEGLEARQSFRTVQKRAIQQTMRSGAKGIKTVVSGRLGGADIARGEGYSEGVVPLHTLRSDIDYAWEEAMTTYGKLGVKVWICRGEVLPGEMVKEPELPKQNRGPRRPRNDRRPRGERGNRPARNAEAKPTTEGGNE